MDNKSKILIVFPIVLVIIFAVAANYVPFREGFSDTERGMMDFMQSDLTVKVKEYIRSAKALQGPFAFNFAAPGRKVQDVNKAALREREDRMRVSLIVISGESRMAMVNGNIVTEGERIDDMKIIKIEPERVLLRNKTSKWVYMEK